jgi:hypothetical protein
MTERIIGPTGSRRRRRFSLLAPLAVVLALFLPGLVLALDLPQPGGAPNDPQFEVDGNLLSEAAGKLDWATGSAGTGVITATRNADGTCTQSGTFTLGGPGSAGTGTLICDGSVGNFADQNGFTAGSKEESGPNPEPWVVSAVGSPKKADLAEVYVYGKLFESPFDADTQVDDLAFVLDLTRLDVNGDTHADFEFNQKPAVQPCANPSDGNLCQPRTAGDFLVSFDLPRGGATPTTTFFRFTTNATKGPSDVCANAPQATFANGCYVEIPAPGAIGGEPGAFAILNHNAAGTQEIPAAPWKSVGCERTSDNNSPGCALRTNIPDKGNMEAYVDLTAFLGNNFNLCPGFGQVTPKTRSSDGLNSALQDIAGPVPITAKVCGSLLIKKFGPDGSTLLPGAGYTITPSTIDRLGTQVVADGGSADKADGNDGVVCLDDVRFGDYTVQETTVPSGFFGDPATKNVTVSPSPSTCADRLAGGNAAATADVTFTNKLGSILIKKLRLNADGTTSLLGGATFTVTPDPSLSNPGASLDVADNGAGDASNVDGVICIDNVRNLGTGNNYTVTEKTPPSGFFGDSSSITVGVHSPSTCADRINADGTLKAGQSFDATFTNKLGSILIKKLQRNADGSTSLVGGATFTVTPDPSVSNPGASLDVPDNGAGDSSNVAGVICIDNVRNLGAGNDYTVTEKSPPSGFFGDSSSITVGVHSPSTCADRINPDGTLKTGQSFDATFTNLLGSILIRKEAKNKNVAEGVALLGGATFTITPDPSLSNPGASLDVTDNSPGDANPADGLICIDNVRDPGAGGYSIAEKTAPANYAKDGATKTIAQASISKQLCSARSTAAGSEDVAFTNVPLSKIDVTFTSKAGAGVTQATINDCKGGSTQVPLSSSTFDDLPPGTYNCTIVIDP